MEQHGTDLPRQAQEAPETETVTGCTNDDSAALVARMRAGDPGAWHEAVSRYEPRLRRIARQYRLPHQEIDDVAQVTWLRCLEHLDELIEAGRLRPWLETICRRECLRRATRGQREVTLGEHGLASLIDRGAPQPDLLADLTTQDNCARLDRAITALPDRQRTVVRELLDREDQSYREVSSRIGVPVGSLGPTWKRAITRLRQDPALAGLDPAS